MPCENWGENAHLTPMSSRSGNVIFYFDIYRWFRSKLDSRKISENHDFLPVSLKAVNWTSLGSLDVL